MAVGAEEPTGRWAQRVLLPAACSNQHGEGQAEALQQRSLTRILLLVLVEFALGAGCCLLGTGDAEGGGGSFLLVAILVSPIFPCPCHVIFAPGEQSKRLVLCTHRDE